LRNSNYDQLKAAYFYRKTLKAGFLTGHVIIGMVGVFINWLD
jgi:hypothetical protein